MMVYYFHYIHLLMDTPPLALFTLLLPNAHLTTHSKISGSRWVITPLWLSEWWISYLYSSSVYSCHVFLISSVSVRSILFLYFYGARLCMKYSLQFNHSVLSDSAAPWQLHARPPGPSGTPGVYSNSCPLSWWCHPTISSSVVPFSPWLQYFPATGSFQMSQFFAWGHQSIGVSALTWVLPINIQDWFPLGWSGWISLQSKVLSTVFSNTTVQKRQFFSVQLSL